VWGLENVTIADERLRINFHLVGIVTLGLSLVMSVFSGVEYFVGFVRAVQVHAKKDAPPPP